MSDLVLEEFNDPFPVRGHWMTIIQLISDQFKVHFKNYFHTPDLAGLSQKTFHKPKFEIGTTQIIDFSKEYCNLMAGEVKWFFSEQGFSVEQSLPMQMLSFDELFFFRNEYFLLFERNWRLKGKEGSVINSLRFEILDPEAFETLDTNIDLTTKRDGRMVLL
jgi:hypothetical protein